MILAYSILLLLSFVARTTSIHSFLPLPHVVVGTLRTVNRHQSNDKAKKFDKLVRLRGGADSSDDKSADGKIKGVCIGIDLGTTYRYKHIYI